MREFSVPTQVHVEKEANLTDAVFDNAAQYPETVAFLRKSGDDWKPVTTADFADQVRSLAKGLVARGVQPGDRVGLLSKTRFEWTLADYAIWTAGAVTVPIYETSSPEQVAWILGDSGAVAVIVETPLHKGVVEQVRGDLDALKELYVIEAGGIDELIGAGKAVSDDDIEERRRSLDNSSLATVIYTSGTTGRPKGCQLTHGNFVFDATATTEGLGHLFRDDATTLLFIPLAHVFARIIQVGCVINRVTLGHSADVKNLLADLAVFQPTFILSVPRIFEKVYNGAVAKTREEGGAKVKIFNAAEKTAVAYSEALQRGSVPPHLRVTHAVFDKLVYSKLRGLLGGKVDYAVSGGAPLGARLGHFFRGVGVTVLEGYGLTETTAGATCNLPDAIKIGTVGRPIPGGTVKIAEDGEILLRGDNIFKGYWHNEKATSEVLEDDGYLHTGDIGELDDDGYLKITGRKKELIVTAGGKNVAPAVLEDRLRGHPLVSQCLVVGDNKPFIGCLVTIDPEAFPQWKKENGKPESAQIEDLVDDKDLRNEVQKAVDEANNAVSRAEAIRKFRILKVDFTEEGGQMTPTLKLKRNVVAKEFSSDIEALYS
ncbi:MAG TPA: long-chain fatty acid--CoA ligase [Frankiaceae bacterium]|nr:long-chain fatty acid--CoA ligase [Frankiaceae bacterium]